MSLRNIGIVYRKELTEALRDRRTLITTFLVPLLLIPVMGMGFTGMMSMVIGNAKKEKPKIMVLGGTDSPAVLDGLKQDGKLKVVPTTSDWKKQIIEKEIRAAVEIPDGFQENLRSAMRMPAAFWARCRYAAFFTQPGPKPDSCTAQIVRRK